MDALTAQALEEESSELPSVEDVLSKVTARTKAVMGSGAGSDEASEESVYPELTSDTDDGEPSGPVPSAALPVPSALAAPKAPTAPSAPKEKLEVAPVKPAAAAGPGLASTVTAASPKAQPESSSNPATSAAPSKPAASVTAEAKPATTSAPKAETGSHAPVTVDEHKPRTALERLKELQTGGRKADPASGSVTASNG